MEIRRHRLPTCDRRRRPPRNYLLEAIGNVKRTWDAAGRDPVAQRHPDGRVDHDPDFLAELAAEHTAIREAAAAQPREPDPVVSEVLAVKEQREDGRLVCRAVVRWSDDTVGDALAWYSGTATIQNEDLLGRTGSELDLLLLWRLAHRS